MRDDDSMSKLGRDSSNKKMRGKPKKPQNSEKKSTGKPKKSDIYEKYYLDESRMKKSTSISKVISM